MEKFYYVDWTMDWADEGDVCGFEIIDEEELNKRKAWLREHPEAMAEIYWGSNESIELTSKDLLSFLTSAVSITKEQCDTITKVIGWGFGYCNWFEEFVERWLEEMDYEEDNE